MKSDYFKLALKNLKKRKLRSWLTMLGIFISIATIFVLISLSIGLQEAVEEQFRLLGTDKFFIMPLGQIGAPGSGGAVELTLNDFNVVERVSGVKDATYIATGNAKIEYKGTIKYYIVNGIPLEKMSLFSEVESFKAEEGRVLEKGDNGKIMIGNDFKNRNILGKAVSVGDKIVINGKEFGIKGIMAPIGNPSDDSNIMMSYEDFRELFNSGERIDAIYVQIESGEEMQNVVDRTEKRLLKSRGLTEKTKDFNISTPEELLKSFQDILGIITIFLIGVAAISLIVGAIGIINTMYTSVLERTKEIGIMKAIGAKNSDVLWIFLIESGLLGLVGGIIGVILGFGISKFVEFIIAQALNTNLLKVAAPLYLVFGCLAFAFVIGIVSGILPAWQASKTKIVDALRYE